MILLGIGNRPGLNKLNNKLRELAWDFGQKYEGLTALGPDGVHLADYQPMLQSLQILVDATSSRAG